ncbi:unnamed protein product [Closterium sp. NIES-53]
MRCQPGASRPTLLERARICPASAAFTDDGWYCCVPPEPPVPPQPPESPAPPSPPAPPTPPAPPAPPNPPVLRLLNPSAFDEYLSESERNKAPDEYVEVPAPAPRWGGPEGCTWDESAVGTDDDVADSEEECPASTEAGTAEDVFPEGTPGGGDDDVEYWSHDGLPEKLLIPSFPPINREAQVDWTHGCGGVGASVVSRIGNPPQVPHGVEVSRRDAQGSTLRTEAYARSRERLLVQADGAEGLCQATRVAPQGTCRLRRASAGVTPLWLEMPATTTVDQTGVRSVPIRSAGYQKERLTVMLACTADGEKLKPWVFFKRKTVPKGGFPPDVVVAVHPNGWMDAPDIICWLEEYVKPFIRPRFGRQAKSAMVVLDSYRGHLTDEVKEKFIDLDIVPAVIPSDCTAEVQPLDVSVNKSFKASIRQ